VLDHPVVVGTRQRVGVVGVRQCRDRPVLLTEENAVLDVVAVEVLAAHQVEIRPGWTSAFRPRIRPAAAIAAVRVSDAL
jgi:hypothetical protein